MAKKPVKKIHWKTQQKIEKEKAAKKTAAYERAVNDVLDKLEAARKPPKTEWRLIEDEKASVGAQTTPPENKVGPQPDAKSEFPNNTGTIVTHSTIKNMSANVDENTMESQIALAKAAEATANAIRAIAEMIKPSPNGFFNIGR